MYNTLDLGDRLRNQHSLQPVPILIVGYRNAGDVVACLRALSNARDQPRFEIFICENGGNEAYEALVGALAAEDAPCRVEQSEDAFPASIFKQRCLLELQPWGHGRQVHVGEAPENLGYAAGINAWLRPLMAVPGWPAIWILNPDTEPAPDALFELAAYSRLRGKGMVGSRIVSKTDPSRVQNRGLAWRRLRCATLSVDFQAAADAEFDSDDLEARLDVPSGASMYVTRECVGAIGLMDERYFLYFEDLEWGLRAKKAFGIGYAHRSVVCHAGGTTIGGSGHRAEHSALSVYLDFRNRILFVRSRFPRWLPWTIVMQVLDALRYAAWWRLENFRASLRGIAAGICGETGRPDGMLNKHRSGSRRG